MQHGEAVPAETDPHRPLSEEGRRSVAAVAAHAAAHAVHIERIVHSTKLRAEQSAGLLAEALGCSDVRAAAGLAPNDSVQAAAAALIDPVASSVRHEPGDPAALAVVGHLPSLDRLASLLVTGDPDAHVIAFRNAGLVRLVPTDPARSASGGPSGPSSAPRPPNAPAARFAVAWILPPELAAAPRA